MARSSACQAVSDIRLGQQIDHVTRRLILRVHWRRCVVTDTLKILSCERSVDESFLSFCPCLEKFVRPVEQDTGATLRD